MVFEQFSLQGKSLEKWDSSHPPHLSIFNTYFDPKKAKWESDINLWHEVSVLKSEDVETFYSYCQHDTGLLAAFNDW
ncbi:phenylacetaldoxime dehydratase family protein [Siminovitchia terrae]|uniref:Uncharacterized protein n=1 Tax=Siminovitchia terrae TaxID=1914933 RepID=A0A429X6I5_SIMTE|nr:hypothetical protein D5F11_015060 [Siminovitchia terrae]